MPTVQVRPDTLYAWSGPSLLTTAMLHPAAATAVLGGIVAALAALLSATRAPHGPGGVRAERG